MNKQKQANSLANHSFSMSVDFIISVLWSSFSLYNSTYKRGSQSTAIIIRCSFIFPSIGQQPTT